MNTRTGNFKIGIRRGWSDWQKSTASVINFARDNAFKVVDLNKLTAEDATLVKQAGLSLGTVDLISFGEIATPDAGKRAELKAQNLTYIKDAAALGAKVFFTVIGAEATKTRAENYKAAVEAFAPLAEAAAAVGTTIAIEGYPGGPPSYPLLCTTPETCRAILKDIPKGISLNYDPSHLIRLGVDHIRFLHEFVPHVVHVHGKDTELFSDGLYEFGLYQPSAFEEGRPFGSNTWRYTIPGHGVARWTEIFTILKKANYGGAVCIELEDQFFNGTEAGEKEGLLHGANFLKSA